jgi:4-aminobutyrate aminotransferase
VDNARERGEQALGALRAMAVRHAELIRDVRGKGLMLALEFATGEVAEAVQWACFERGLLVLQCGASSLRLSPPLVVSPDEIETALVLLQESIEDVARRAGRPFEEAAKAGGINEVEAGD